MKFGNTIYLASNPKLVYNSNGVAEINGAQGLSQYGVLLASLGHEWKHDGGNELTAIKEELKKKYPEKSSEEIDEILKTQYKDEYEKAVNEEANCVHFQNAIVEGLINTFGGGLFEYDKKLFFDYMAEKTANELKPDEAEALFKDYIANAHDVVGDNWKFDFLGNQLYGFLNAVTTQDGDNIQTLKEQLTAYLMANLKYNKDLIKVDANASPETIAENKKKVVDYIVNILANAVKMQSGVKSDTEAIQQNGKTQSFNLSQHLNNFILYGTTDVNKIMKGLCEQYQQLDIRKNKNPNAHTPANTSKNEYQVGYGYPASGGYIPLIKSELEEKLFENNGLIPDYLDPNTKTVKTISDSMEELAATGMYATEGEKVGKWWADSSKEVYTLYRMLASLAQGANKALFGARIWVESMMMTMGANRKGAKPGDFEPNLRFGRYHLKGPTMHIDQTDIFKDGPLTHTLWDQLLNEGFPSPGGRGAGTLWNELFDSYIVGPKTNGDVSKEMIINAVEKSNMSDIEKKMILGIIEMKWDGQKAFVNYLQYGQWSSNPYFQNNLLINYNNTLNSEQKAIQDYINLIEFSYSKGFNSLDDLINFLMGW